jgi:hypothetical protein
MAAKKTDRQNRKAAKLIASGVGFKDALIASGYSPKQARKGRAALGKRLRGMVQEELLANLDLFAELGAGLTPELTEDVIRGRLVDNLLKGEDRATQSAKLLGSDKRLNMFGPDAQNCIVLAMPKTPWPKLEAHVLPTELDE